MRDDLGMETHPPPHKVVNVGIGFYDDDRSDWVCALFGVRGEVMYRPRKGNVPNRFWRWMQYLMFGNRCRKDPLP